MRTVNNVDFYAKEDTLYSRGGFIALDDKLEPCGIFPPGIKGFENTESAESIDKTALATLAKNYKTMVAQ